MRLSTFLRMTALVLGILVFSLPLVAQSDAYFVTPHVATILVGDSQRFRMVDSQGHMQKTVSWSVFPNNAAPTYDDDELILTGKYAGEVKVTAKVPGGEAEATVKIIEGRALPTGTTKWSAPAPAGCRTTKITPATPSPNGAAVFVTMICPNGTFVNAYTDNGNLLWQHQVSSERHAVPTAQVNAPSASIPSDQGKLNFRAASICDRLVVGNDQPAVREALKASSLTAIENSPRKNVWLVEEPGTQCELTFDDKLMLTRKRKIFLAE